MARITGREAVSKKLLALPKQVKARVGPEIVSQADEMVRMMRALAPVKSGALKRSIGVDKKSDMAGTYSVRVKAGGRPTMVELRKGSGKQWDYALGFEYGIAAHKAGGKFKGAEIPAIRRQPFFWPVYRLVKKKYRRRIANAVRKGIKDISGS